MSIRYCGDVKVVVGGGSGKIIVPTNRSIGLGPGRVRVWRYHNLNVGSCRGDCDSREAEAAVGFAAYYGSDYGHGRKRRAHADVPRWAPTGKLADRIDSALEHGDQGPVCRRKPQSWSYWKMKRRAKKGYHAPGF